VYEYMAAGLPVVASRIGQLAELIGDGVTGLLCQPGNPEDLAEALERLLHDPRLRTSLGQAARAAVLQNFLGRCCKTHFPACRQCTGVAAPVEQAQVEKDFA
jgi:glycosyltransferase involved in cell wall biosynthesis